MPHYCLSAEQVFDGQTLQDRLWVELADGRITGLHPQAPQGIPCHDLGAGILAPGLLDLQVNGGGGVMVGADTDAAQLRQICDAHRALGTTGLMPTLITESAKVTAQVIAAGIAAKDHAGFLGLHLEGPHLDPKRAGAHHPDLIRAMEEEDLARLCEAAQHLPALIVTLAPASVSLDQIARLAAAGVIVSLGHAEATAAEAEAAFGAGAQMVTHLFNAMSQMGNREGGLVGAALAGRAWAGVIADGHHISAHSLAVALAARPQGLFLVTDAMAVAGTDADHFILNGRRVLRRDGKLVLENGTLAGADLTLPQALAYLVGTMGQPVARALAMATSLPAQIIGAQDRGVLRAGARADLVHLGPDLTLKALWQGGVQHVTK